MTLRKTGHHRRGVELCLGRGVWAAEAVDLGEHGALSWWVVSFDEVRIYRLYL